MSSNCQLIFENLRNIAKSGRVIVAIAGPPASGKSTLALDLCARLNAETSHAAAILPMDGFHYDDAILKTRGDLARKGAPHTFDVDGFQHLLSRLAANQTAEIAVPTFDRSLEIARNCAVIIPQSVQYLIVEGNYLLLEQKPWSALHSYFDLTILLKVPRDVIEARLWQRWHALPKDEARQKICQNDLINAETVRAQSIEADINLNDGET